MHIEHNKKNQRRMLKKAVLSSVIREAVFLREWSCWFRVSGCPGPSTENLNFHAETIERDMRHDLRFTGAENTV